MMSIDVDAKLEDRPLTDRERRILGVFCRFDSEAALTAMLRAAVVAGVDVLCQEIGEILTDFDATQLREATLKKQFEVHGLTPAGESHE